MPVNFLKMPVSEWCGQVEPQLTLKQVKIWMRFGVSILGNIPQSNVWSQNPCKLMPYTVPTEEHLLFTVKIKIPPPFLFSQPQYQSLSLSLSVCGTHTQKKKPICVTQLKTFITLDLWNKIQQHKHTHQPPISFLVLAHLNTVTTCILILPQPWTRNNSEFMRMFQSLIHSVGLASAVFAPDV